MNKEEIGAKLRDLRTERGYTQKQLAEILEISNPSTIGSWEIGKSEPSLSTFAKICEVYKISNIDEIFPGLSNEKATPEEIESGYAAIFNELNLGQLSEKQIQLLTKIAADILESGLE